jgi:hypothetical protein
MLRQDGEGHLVVQKGLGNRDERRKTAVTLGQLQSGDAAGACHCVQQSAKSPLLAGGTRR